MGIVMKKFLLGAAAALAIAAPAVASAETNAVVTLDVSSAELDDLDWTSYGLEGAFNHDFSNGTFVQFDASTDRIDLDGCCYSTSYAAAHYGVRNDNYALAGFVSFDELFIYSGLGLGVEGQLYLSNIVLNGSIAHTDFDDADFSTTSAAIDATYFFNPNLGVTGLVSFADDEIYGDDVTAYGISGAYRFAGSPASIELGVRQTELFDEDVTAWTLGVTLDFGMESLQERATRGPSLSGASSAHEYLGFFAPVI
jgi:opacity protein-like surface antigen